MTSARRWRYLIALGVVLLSNEAAAQSFDEALASARDDIMFALERRAEGQKVVVLAIDADIEARCDPLSAGLANRLQNMLSEALQKRVGKIFTLVSNESEADRIVLVSWRRFDANRVDLALRLGEPQSREGTVLSARTLSFDSRALSEAERACILEYRDLERQGKAKRPVAIRRFASALAPRMGELLTGVEIYVARAVEGTRWLVVELPPYQAFEQQQRYGFVLADAMELEGEAVPAPMLDSAAEQERRRQQAAVEQRIVLAQRELDARAARIDELARSIAVAEADKDTEARANKDAQAEVRRLGEQLQSLSLRATSADQKLAGQVAEIVRRDVQIAELGKRLNQALVNNVAGEFFGRMRGAIGDRKEIRIVGDRFMVGSDLRFEPGESRLGPAAQAQLVPLAAMLVRMAADLPPDLPWVIQVDGHADRREAALARNDPGWELSAARAISVTRFLVAQGIPADRVAARGLAEFHPLDPSDGDDAFRRNRRIEIRLTNQ